MTVICRQLYFCGGYDTIHLMNINYK
jgi:hypothetical protein